MVDVVGNLPTAPDGRAMPVTQPRSVAKAALLASITILASPVVVAAEDNATDARLAIELNAAESTTDGCSLSFLIVNDLPDPIDGLVLEAVLFDQGGQVDTLTLFDFGSLPAGRPRVRQFALTGPSCEQIGSILINGAETCETGGGVLGLCEDALDLSTRVEIDLIG